MSRSAMRIVLLSSTAFGYKCLKESVIPLQDVEVTGILTTSRHIDISFSDKPVDIKTHVDFTDLRLHVNCPVVQMKGKITSDSYLKHIVRWRPDLLLVLGWYYMVPKRVRESVSLGCVGIHASLLPKYRGGAPIPWCIINGEKESGISFFYLEDGVDTGDIIAQVSYPIDYEDTCASVYEKATWASIEVLRQYLPMIAKGTAPRFSQDESEATIFPQRKPEDGLIDWSWSAKRVYDFIRAQTKPYPGAFTFLRGQKLTIWKARIVEKADEGTLGKVIGTQTYENEDGFLVNLSDAALLVTEIGTMEEPSLRAIDYIGRHLSETSRIVLGQ
jgi:methionyl-tRNA formyltransferase